MAPSTPLLTVRGSEGLYMVNGPPHFTESTVLPRESGKNCKVYTFSKDGTLFAWNNGEKLVLIYGKFYGHNEYYTAGMI